MSARTLKVRVARKRTEALQICSFELVDPEGHDLPEFTAGAHVDVTVTGGMTRQYSLCNDSSERHRYLIAVLREAASRGGSRAMHDEIHEGSILQISEPKNHFPLAPAVERSLLLAGGIGVTPILAMAEHLARAGADFDMHYCARSSDRMAFRERLLNAPFASRVQLHFDDGTVEQRLDIAQLLATSNRGTHLYVCGPKGFMDAALSTARACGWPQEQLHCEFFAAEVTSIATDVAFDVYLARSGRTVHVPKDRTVVHALAAAGIDVPVSCEQGVCGTCLTRVLQGVPDHRDCYLMPDERAANDRFTPCCSRAKSPRLVVDL